MDTSSTGTKNLRSDERTGWSGVWLLLGLGTWATSVAFSFPVSLILILAGAGMTRLSLSPASRRVPWRLWEILLLVISIGLVVGMAWTGESASRAFGWALVFVIPAIVLPPTWQFAKALFDGYSEARRIRNEVREMDPSRR